MSLTLKVNSKGFAVLYSECEACDGTGIYQGMAEPVGTGVVCLRCNGSGCEKINVKVFVRRKRAKGVSKVYRSRGSFIAAGVGPNTDRKSVPYSEFLKGKMPG